LLTHFVCPLRHPPQPAHGEVHVTLLGAADQCPSPRVVHLGPLVGCTMCRSTLGNQRPSLAPPNPRASYRRRDEHIV
jgi:hypothetical protein